MSMGHLAGVGQPAAKGAEEEVVVSSAALTPARDVVAALAIAALVFATWVYLLYAILNVMDPTGGFAPVQAPPALMAAAILPLWSMRYTKLVLARCGSRDLSAWRRRALRSPLLHMAAWWVPVVNTVLPFVLLGYELKLDSNTRVQTWRMLALWALAWSGCSVVLWVGAVGLGSVLRIFIGGGG